MQLPINERFTDEEGEWEIIGFTTNGHYSAVSRGSSFVVEAPSKGARSRTGTGIPLGSFRSA
jgi:hypothetical protein